MPNTILGPNGVLLQVVPDDVKVDVRRFCGYGSYGFGATGFFEMGWFLPSYQVLELRIETLTVSEYARVTGLYLSNLYQIETDIFNTRQTVNIQQAAVYTRNLNEVRERHSEFSWWRRQLCSFFGIPPGPELVNSGMNNLAIHI